MVSTRMAAPVFIVFTAKSSIACMTAGTPAMTYTLPMRKPGASEIGFSISSAVAGMRAMRRRAGVRSPGA